MSIPPQPAISFPCVRGTSEVVTFYYLDDDGVTPISKTGKTMTAEFTDVAGGAVDFTVVPTWDGGTGLVTLTLTAAMTDISPGDYFADVHVASVSEDLVIVRIQVSITPSYP